MMLPQWFVRCTHLTMLLCMLLVSLVTLMPPVHAQEVSPPPLAEDAVGDTFSLQLLGFDERTLIGPFDSAEFYFSFPEHWALTQDGEVQLNMSVFFSGAGFELVPGTTIGSLQVSFNFNPLTSLPIDWSGDRTVTVTIPAWTLQDTLSSGRHVLGVSLNSSLDCGNDIQTNVLIRPTSQMVIPHTAQSPQTDLTLLPRPIYQRSFLTDRAIMVIPDTPSPAELQSALAVAAGFARMTEGELEFSTTTASTLTEEERAAEHLILVGRAGSLPLLNDLELPIPLDGAQFASSGAATNDGILQMIVSPWNSTKVLMVVGGNTDRGVIRAGQALSSGTLNTAIVIQPDLILIDDIEERADEAALSTDIRTFADMGYQQEIRARKGWHEIEYNFSVPPGHVAELEAYLDLVFNHSALLDYERSGLSVFLNGQVIGSVSFSDETTEMSTRRISIPPSALRFGNNQIVILLALIPKAVCIDPDLVSVWGTIWSESTIHLPLQKVQVDNAGAINLSEYPAPFTANPTLANTAFVLPRDAPSAWKVAAHLAYQLGTSFEGELLEVTAVYGDAIPDDVRDNHDLLIVGRPSHLPVVEELSDAMPISFEPQSDVTTSLGSRVLYRFPESVDLGYLQLLAAPWNEERTILMVLGSSNTGVQSAAALLHSDEAAETLVGNFAVVNGIEITSGDTRRGVRPDMTVPESLPIDRAETVPISVPAALTTTSSITAGAAAAPMNPRPAELEHPGWVVPLIGVSTVLMVLIVLVVAVSIMWRSLVSRRISYQATKEHN